MQMCIECMGEMKAPRMSYGTEIQSSLSQSCQNYSTWTEHFSEKHNSCQHQHFPLPKGWRFTTKLKKKAVLLPDAWGYYTAQLWHAHRDKKSHRSSAHQSSDKQCLTVSLQAALCRTSGKPLVLKCCWMLPWPLQNSSEIYSWSRMAF